MHTRVMCPWDSGRFKVAQCLGFFTQRQLTAAPAAQERWREPQDKFPKGTIMTFWTRTWRYGDCLGTKKLLEKALASCSRLKLLCDHGSISKFKSGFKHVSACLHFTKCNPTHEAAAVRMYMLAESASSCDKQLSSLVDLLSRTRSCAPL